MNTANLFFSLLTIATNIALVAMLVIVVANRLGKPVAQLGRLREAALPLATAVATVSTLGSLYYSEIANLRPCVLCWYQRGAMYPLAVLLLVALFTQRRHLWRFAVGLSLIGVPIAGYHYMIQRNPAAAVEGVCSADVPCTAVELWEFGFISMAYMALSAFLFVAAAMWFGVRPTLAVPVTDPAKPKGRKQPSTDPNRGLRDAGMTLTATLAVAGVAAALLAPAPAIAPAEPGQEPREVVAPTVEGDPLPEFADPANDPAAGQPLPVITGTDYSGRPVTVSKDGAKVIMVMAHWCPHCQSEVPKIQQWLNDNGFPDGVALYSISSGAQANAPNYPPDEWLQREGWEVPVIADDDIGTARTAVGLSGYPFFVFVEFDGAVSYRHAGAMPIEEFAQRIEGLQAGIPG
jgi:cytochrome c biogenesis protein CcmG, thiol:disulfide interchange protein DsbE